MLVQVLQLTQEQINALDPAQQASVKQLVSFFLAWIELTNSGSSSSVHRRNMIRL